MPRYRTFGGLDDVESYDGDVQFLGVNQRLPSWQLPAGILTVSENGRIDGDWRPRRGVEVITDGTLGSGSPLRVPFWLDDTGGGSVVSSAVRVDDLVTLTVTAHGLPVSGAAASVVVNPSGANNSILYTAVSSGPSGGDISIEYVLDGSSDTVVSVDVNAITVHVSPFSWMDVSGPLTDDLEPVVFPTMADNGLIGGKTSYIFVDTDFGQSYEIYWNSTLLLWVMSDGAAALWTSPDNVATPDLVTTWTAIPPAAGTPVVAGTFAADASYVIGIVNSDPLSSAMVTASASGSVTGAVSAIGPVFLQGGSSVSSFMGLEGIGGSPTVPVNGVWLMTPIDANTITFEVPGASGGESYDVTLAKVRSVVDDFASETVLGSCLFSDPNSGNLEYIFLAYGLEVMQVALADGTVTTIGLPGSVTLDGEVSMIQALDKVYIFRDGLVALEWSPGDADFALVLSGTYGQPQVFNVTGTFVDVVAGLCTITGLTNTTVAEGDTIRIYGTTDSHFTDYVDKEFFVTAANGTSFSFYIPVSDLSTIAANTLSIGRRVSIGGGFIYQPVFPWCVYFQRRLWGPYRWDWDGSAFDDRGVRDEMIASDILDGDTYDVLGNQFRITGGTADYIVALHPFFDDALVVLNRNSIHAIYGTVGSLADTSVKELTREVGCIARKSVVSQGNRVFFLSDNGVYGLEFQDLYNLRGMERPLSENIQPYIDRVSEGLASMAVGVYHNNRYWLAVPLDSSKREGDATGNNAILVFNMLNNEWESVDTFGSEDFDITNLIVGAEGDRNGLYAVTSTGGIHALDRLDDVNDRIATNPVTGAVNYPISARMTTRAYVCGTTDRKRFTQLGVQMKSGTSLSDIGVSFSTDDPDSAGAEALASAGMASSLIAGNTADVRQRIGGIRGFNGSVSIRRVTGRPSIRGVNVVSTITNRATLTQI